MKKIQGAVLLLALASPACFAQSLAAAYVGLSVGQSNTKFDSTDFAGDARVARTDDKTDSAYKLFAGYRFSPTWAMEAGYADLGTPSVSFSNAFGSARASVDNSSWFIAGKGTFPVTATIGLFGKLGLTRNKSKLNYTTNFPGDTPGSATDTRSGLLWGIGAEYAFNRNLGLRFEYEDFGKFGKAFDDASNSGTGRTKVNLWTVGLTYSF